MDAGADVRVLLLSGSTRGASTNTAALRTAARVAPAGVTPVLLDLLRQLPAFDPDEDRDPLPLSVAALRRAVGDADAVLFCTPEYAGSLPGSLKNLLDWTVGGGEADGTPMAWLNVAAQGRGAGASAALATVLGYVGADVVEAACVQLPVPRSAVGPDGLLDDGELRAGVAGVLEVLARHVRQRRGDAGGVSDDRGGGAPRG